MREKNLTRFMVAGGDHVRQLTCPRLDLTHVLVISLFVAELGEATLVQEGVIGVGGIPRVPDQLQLVLDAVDVVLRRIAIYYTKISINQKLKILSQFRRERGRLKSKLITPAFNIITNNIVIYRGGGESIQNHVMVVGLVIRRR